MAVIANDLGVSRTFLYQLKDGTRQPSIEVALMLQSKTGGKVSASDWPNLSKVAVALSESAAE